MAKYRKKPIIIEATQWFRQGDSENVGKVPERFCEDIDPHVRRSADIFLGYIDTLEVGHIVLPGDWIIKGVKGDFYPCKPDIFEQTYEFVED